MNKTIVEQSERQLQLLETIKNTLQSIKTITDKNADEAADLGQNLEQSSEKLEHIVGQFKVWNGLGTANIPFSIEIAPLFC